jgi:iron complex outermembrane recepter protein
MMSRMNALACCLCMIVLGTTPAVADNHANAPKSLQMRSRSPAAAQSLPIRWGKRTAQAPAPDQPPADGDQPSVDKADGSLTAPAATDQPAVTSDPVPAAPEPAAQSALELSDAEFAKLAEQESKEEVIIITGSTIGRKTLTTPAPLTILNREALHAAGRATVGDIIQTLPAQQNGVNAQTNNGGDGSTRVDIRGLGAARTLVLINGRRVVPSGSGANNSVDVTTRSRSRSSSASRSSRTARRRSTAPTRSAAW